MKKNTVLIILILILSLNSLYLFDNFSNNYNLCYASNVSQIEKQQITMEEAKDIAERRFEKYGVKNIEFVKKGIGEFNYYEFNITLKDGQECCIMVSARDGNLIKIDCFEKQMPIPKDDEECLELTQKHINELGFGDVRVIWFTKLRDEKIINLAPIEENVVVYPDLLKVRVNCKTGNIIDVEARAYLNEFYPRLEAEFLVPTVPFEDVREGLREDFIIISYRLALIFDDKGKERLVYELRSQYEDFLYLIYIDAKTGEQVRAMPIIE